MEREVRFAVPAEGVERFPVQRTSVQALKSDRQREHGRLGSDSRGEEEPVERQNSRAVAGRGLGKNLNAGAVAQRAAHTIGATDAAMRVFPIDKERSADFREPSEQGPAAHLGLR